MIQSNQVFSKYRYEGKKSNISALGILTKPRKIDPHWVRNDREWYFSVILKKGYKYIIYRFKDLDIDIYIYIGL